MDFDDSKRAVKRSDETNFLPFLFKSYFQGRITIIFLLIIITITFSLSLFPLFLE